MENVENKQIRNLANTFANSLDNTQKNATDTEKVVGQILDLSDKGNHSKIIGAILEDDQLSMEEKIRFINEEDEKFDKRLDNNTYRLDRVQESQKDRIKEVSNSCSWICGALIIAVAVVPCIVATPECQKLLGKAMRRLAA